MNLISNPSNIERDEQWLTFLILTITIINARNKSKNVTCLIKKGE